MKALKVLGIIVLLLAVAVGVFWVGWLRPPPAEDVCDNLASLTEKETQVKWGDAERQECIKKFSTPPEFGLMPWVKRVKCVRDAGSLADVEKCRG